VNTFYANKRCLLELNIGAHLKEAGYAQSRMVFIEEITIAPDNYKL
jgi:hypothetical protein